MSAPRDLTTPTPEQTPQAPQAERIETDHDHTPVRDERPLHLAQDLVRIRGEIQRMHQDDRIDAVGGNRQTVRFSNDHVRFDSIRTLADQGLVPNRTIGEVGHIAANLAELQQLVTEQVSDHRGQGLALAGRDTAARLPGIPLSKCLSQLAILLMAKSGL